jgi:hypothetical protein
VAWIACKVPEQTISNEPALQEQWGRVDSLTRNGQYRSALDILNDILSSSADQADWKTEFKAWSHKSLIRRQLGDEYPDLIVALDARATAAGSPLKQLLHSLIASAYWDYYQQERWRVLDRTNTAGSPEDMRTWGQQRFIDETLKHFELSLTDRDRLLKIPSAELGELSLEGDYRLRPTLFDLLAHRALDILKNPEARMAEPAWRFRLDDERAFNLFEDFAYRRTNHPDSMSLLLRAMNVYKELAQIHLNDDDPTALILLDLERLSFVHYNSIHPNKDSLYLNALETLITRIRDTEVSSDVYHAIALWHDKLGNQYQRLVSDEYKWEKKNALEICQKAISAFPESVGAQNCRVLKEQLLRRSILIQPEMAIPPDQESLVSVSYRNVNRLHLRMYRLSAEVDEIEPPNDKELGKILGRKPDSTWSVGIPNDSDLNEHVVEIPITALEVGRYLLVASDSTPFRPGKNILTYTPFWVTDISLATRGLDEEIQEVLLLSRKSGGVISGARIERFSRVWQSNRSNYEKIDETISTGEFGQRFTSTNNRWRQYRYKITSGEDVLVTDAGAYYNNSTPKQSTRTHFFIDRAIYRPGQDIFFKGLVTKGSHNDHQPVAGYESTVQLIDANGEEISSLDVRTDEYGSFTGLFKAPVGVLNGVMNIRDGNGNRSFRVEEYKRPKFEVIVNPAKGQSRLGERVSVSGIATSFAGIPIDGGVVQWKVNRRSRMPWWCRGFWRFQIPWGMETEVANGTAQTDGQGGFSLEFLAVPDNAIPREASPQYTYEVVASVTDVNGETQTGSRSITCAYETLQVELTLDENIWTDSFKSLPLDIKNLSGEHVDAPIRVRINKLKTPRLPRKGRYTQEPDKYVMDRGEYEKRFPLVAYGRSEDPLNWPIEKMVLSKDLERFDGTPIDITAVGALSPGDYLIEIRTTDDYGSEVTAQKHLILRNRGNGQAATAELFNALVVTPDVYPGQKAEILLSSSLKGTHVLVEVERKGILSERKWCTLNATQEILEFEVSEADRGGFAVHVLSVREGVRSMQSLTINVPWTNKQLGFEWITFRDKLLPGTEEEWRLKIVGEKGSAVAAQLLGGMYDASLDQFVTHDWGLDLWKANLAKRGFAQMVPFGSAYARNIQQQHEGFSGVSRSYPSLNTWGFGSSNYGLAPFLGEVSIQSTSGGSLNRRTRTDAPEAMMDMAAPNDDLAPTTSTVDPIEQMDPVINGTTLGAPIIRSDFRETAFFLPELLTDHEGSVVMRFRTPDAITKWKVLGLAHTKDLQIGSFKKEALTQRPLMVTPNLPRFMRRGDSMVITTKINALEKHIEGTCTLQLFDPFTGSSIDDAFGHATTKSSFIASPGESAVVEWPIVVPAGIDAVGLRIIANAPAGPLNSRAHSDGEEHVLPVLSDKILVTESLPLPVNGPGIHVFDFKKLQKSGMSGSLEHKALTLEFTPNPAWYAVQALPYLMEFPHECSEQLFNRYYSNALASHITKEKPAIRKVFAEWKELGSDALLSNLEKNQELKSVVLEETPWLMDARDEREQKQRIGLLFDLDRMAEEEATTFRKLQEKQYPEGGWGWFHGMRPSRGITQEIVAGVGHLKKLGVNSVSGTGRVHSMMQRAIQWLDKEVARDYQDLKRRLKNEQLDEYRPGYWDIRFLYARSFFPNSPLAGATKEAAAFYRKRIAEDWLQYGLQQQALIALVLHRADNTEVAQLILKSLKERATVDDELGMFWKNFNSGWNWWNFPAETHALMIEGFNEITGDEEAVKELRVYLLKLKQTTNWKTTKATAQACYALLLGGNDWLEPHPLPKITLGPISINGKKLDQEAGTGYIKTSWQGGDVRPEMGLIRIETESDRAAWGGLHWQYLEQMDKITTHDSPFSLVKSVNLKMPTEEGDLLVPLKDVERIEPGDQLTIRIELRTDRFLDYVHLKDLRSAGTEPIEQLSGYRYSGGLGYYLSIKDAAMHFFFDRIDPGTYVFEYDLKVTHNGEFSNGITTAMCMYAPEFNSHSSAERVIVGR